MERYPRISGRDYESADASTGFGGADRGLSLGVANDQLPIIHFFSLHREIPQELDRGNTLPTRQEFPLRLELKANEDDFWGSRAVSGPGERPARRIRGGW
eukprot:Skav200395  [mRNA]  locus=scaffold1919:110890:112768:- [translate_table: standard]